MNTCMNLKPHGKRGKLITFCGLDGCGKSTLIQLLAKELEEIGKTVFLTKQPTDGMRKTNIFRTYMDCEDHSKYEYRALSLMAAADRLQHCSQVILPALEAGKVVISDRYIYSCLANLRARGYTEDRWIYEIATQIPKPDCAFFPDVPVESAVSRVRERPAEKTRYIDMELQYRLRDEYRRICLENDGILLSTECDIRETFQKIRQEIKTLLEENENE